MRLTFLGTAAAEGIPALFCKCEYCTQVRKTGGRQLRSRSQVIVDGELSVDFPPDCFYHAARMEGGFSELRYLLVTHAHTDHFYAHDFVLHGYKYAHPSLPDLEIYGNQEVKEVFEESVRREMRQEVAKSLKIHTVSAFTSFEAGEYHAVPLKATHTSQDPFVFLLEKNGKRYLHLTDTGELPEESVQYVIKSGKRLDCITFDCTFLWEQAGNRHMGLKENMALFSRLKEAGVADSNTLKVITHFSHNSHPTEEALARAQREFGVIPAYDGMTIEF